MSNAQRPHHRVSPKQTEQLLWLGTAVRTLIATGPVPLSVIVCAFADPQMTGRARELVSVSVRKVLHANPRIFVEVMPGVWDLAINCSPRQLERLRHERRQRLASGRKKSQ
jgi:hypothetical protein